MRRSPDRRSFVDRWGVVVAVAAGVLIVSVLPAGGGPAGPLPVSDKLLHGAGYAVLAMTVLRAVRVDPFRRDDAASRAVDVPSALVAAGVVVAVAGYGGAVELLQWPLATRQASLADALANFIGAVAGAVAWRVQGHVRERA